MHIKFDNGQDDSILMMFWILGRFAEVQDLRPCSEEQSNTTADFIYCHTPP